jgi:two-component system, LuxR family, response regulator FixJ
LAVNGKEIAGMSLQRAPTSDLFIVDDDATVRDALSVVFTLAGYRVAVFADGGAFIAASRANPPAAVLLDLHMPDKSGLAVLKEINARHFPAPVFIVSGDGDIAMAVEAVKNGAFDYIVKPFDARAIVARVGCAIAAYAKRHANGSEHALPFVFNGRAQLTPREREVLAQIAAGASNKEAGRCLGISPRTIEVHRARIMEKIGARNAADLVRIVLGGGGRNGSPHPPEMVA